MGVEIHLACTYTYTGGVQVPSGCLVKNASQFTPDPARSRPAGHVQELHLCTEPDAIGSLSSVKNRTRPPSGSSNLASRAVCCQKGAPRCWFPGCPNQPQKLTLKKRAPRKVTLKKKRFPQQHIPIQTPPAGSWPKACSWPRAAWRRLKCMAPTPRRRLLETRDTETLRFATPKDVPRLGVPKKSESMEMCFSGKPKKMDVLFLGSQERSRSHGGEFFLGGVPKSRRVWRCVFFWEAQEKSMDVLFLGSQERSRSHGGEIFLGGVPKSRRVWRCVFFWEAQEKSMDVLFLGFLVGKTMAFRWMVTNIQTNGIGIGMD